MRKLIFLAFPVISCAAILQVGPGLTYTTPCKALAVAQDGDTVQIQAALYTADVCAFSQNNLTIQGINGRPHLAAGGASSQNKAIWVASGSNLLVDNIEFSGAVSTDHNGAGIRAQGVNWTVRNCYFHDNQEGILESNIAGSNILIEFSEFDHNGYGDGQSHNLYIGHAASLIFRYNWSHNAVIGELLKTRAAVNTVEYNRLTDELGTASYELDIPNGGTSYVIGNIIQQGPNSPNENIVAYMEEGSNALNPGMQLYLVNNTIVNDKSVGNFVFVGADDTVPVIIQNNILFGPGTISTQSAATQTSNFTGNPDFVDAADYNYQLESNSGAINAATNPGSANSVSLTPVGQYVQPTCGQARNNTAGLNIGAYGTAGTNMVCGGGTTALNPCDLNADGVVNVIDVQVAVNMTLDLLACTAAVNGSDVCNTIAVQRIINSALGGACVSGL
jgi:hypothetical protein